MIPFKKIRLAYIEEAEEDFVPMPDLYRVGTPTKPDAVFLATDVPNKIGDYMFDCAPSQKNETLTIDILNKLIKLNRTFEQ